jgi:hypothetical protein
MAGYVYRRTDDIEREPTVPYVFRREPDSVKRRPSSKDFDPTRCGTTAGYQQHRRYRQKQCTKCLAAQAEYSRGYRESKAPGDSVTIDVAQMANNN